MNFKKFYKEWILPLGIAAVVAIFFRTTIASPRHIPTGSMIPTIKIGEFIFVNMFAYDWHIPFTRMSLIKRSDPKTGDIVVFEYPLDPDKDYIKRVVGVPGDIVEVVNDRIIINGKPVEMKPAEDRSILEDLTPKYEPAQQSLYKETLGEATHYAMYDNLKDVGDFGPITVPENAIFVMGDNRDDSADSRFWGFVPREKVLGKAGFIWFSFNKDHFPFLRFGRFFTMLK